MKLTKRQLRNILLKEGLLVEGDMISMVTLLAQAAMAVLAVGTPAAILYAHKMLDERMKKAFTRRDLEKIRSSAKPEHFGIIRIIFIEFCKIIPCSRG